MAVTVAELQVSFNAETKKFKAEIASIDKRLGTFEASAKKKAKGASGAFTSLRKNISKVGPAITAAVAALGVAKFVSLSKEAIAFGDAIEQTSKKIGFSSDALQELRFVAEQSGVAQNTLDLALQRFSRRVGEATVGTGEAKKALEEMNIELEDSEGNFRGNEAILADVADAMKNTSSSSDRLRLAFKLFDSEGAGFVNALALGADGMQEFRDQAEDLGIVLDRDLVAKSAEMSTELSIAEKIMKTQFTETMLALAPIAIGLAEAFGGLAEVLADIVTSLQAIEDISLNKAKERQTELLNQLTELRERRDELAQPSTFLIAGLEIDTSNLAAASGTDLIAELDKDIALLESRLAAADAAVDARIKRRKAEDAEGGGGGGGGGGVETPEQTAARKKTESEQKSNLAAILQSTRDIHLARIEAIEPLEAEIAALGFQIADVEKLKVADGEATEAKLANLRLLREEQAKLQTTLGDARQEELDLSIELEEALAQVAAADFDRVEAIVLAAAARESEGQSVEEMVENLKEALAAVKAITGEDGGEDGGLAGFDLGESVGGSVERGVLDGLNSAFSGEGVDILEGFSNTFASIFNDAMSSLLSDLGDQLSDLVNKLADGIANAVGAEGGGGALGAALGAGLAIGGAILIRELQDDQVKVQRANITSAVNSSQQIRGVVAGPTGIAIAKVADHIKEAQRESERLLALIVENTNRIPALGGVSGGAVAGGAFDAFNTDFGPTLG